MLPTANFTSIEQEQFNQLVTDFLDSQFRTILKTIKENIPKGTTLPTCFISYAWGSGFEDRVKILAQYLLAAGVETKYDLYDNLPSTSISGFYRQIDTVNYVILMGTKNLIEKCNKDNYKRAYCAEFYEAKFPEHVNFPVVSREMAHIRKRLKDFLNDHSGHISTFLIPICLEGEYPKIFSFRVLKDIAGFQWQSWPNYQEIFHLLIQLLPTMKTFINNCKEQFKKVEAVKSKEFTNNPTNINFLKNYLVKLGDIKKQQEDASNQHIRDALRNYLHQLGLDFNSEYDNQIANNPLNSNNDNNNTSTVNSVIPSQAKLITQHTTTHSEAKTSLSSRVKQFKEDSAELEKNLNTWQLQPSIAVKNEELTIELATENITEEHAKLWLEKCQTLIDKHFPKVISKVELVGDAYAQTLIIQSKRAQNLYHDLSSLEMFQQASSALQHHS